MVHIFNRLRIILFNDTTCFDHNGVFSYTSFTTELQMRDSYISTYIHRPLAVALVSICTLLGDINLTTKLKLLLVYYIVICCLKAGILESEYTAIARQRMLIETFPRQQ
jgi:hypothetical protein